MVGAMAKEGKGEGRAEEKNTLSLLAPRCPDSPHSLLSFERDRKAISTFKVYLVINENVSLKKSILGQLYWVFGATRPVSPCTQ